MGSETIAMATITGPLTQRLAISPSKRHAIGWGLFKNDLFEPYARHTSTLEETIIMMYSKGITTREIAELIEKMYGQYYSPATVSNITKQTASLVEEFHTRKFKQSQYVCVFLDATYIPLRRDTVEREAVNIVIGIRSDGTKEVLDYCIAPTENGVVWSELLSGLRQRGITDIQLFIADGMVGLQGAIERNYPQARFQLTLSAIFTATFARQTAAMSSVSLKRFARPRISPRLVKSSTTSSSTGRSVISGLSSWLS